MKAKTMMTCLTFAVMAASALAIGEVAMAGEMELAVTGRTRSADGVEIAYTDQGTGPVAIVFIHGGLADRSFWAEQFAALADRYRLVALDLAGPDTEHPDATARR